MQKMINFYYITKEDIKEHNANLHDILGQSIQNVNN